MASDRAESLLRLTDAEAALFAPPAAAAVLAVAGAVVEAAAAAAFLVPEAEVGVLLGVLTGTGEGNDAGGSGVPPLEDRGRVADELTALPGCFLALSPRSDLHAWSVVKVRHSTAVGHH